MEEKIVNYTLDMIKYAWNLDKEKKMKLDITKENAELVEFLVRQEAADVQNLKDDSEALETLADDLHSQIWEEENATPTRA